MVITPSECASMSGALYVVGCSCFSRAAAAAKPLGLLAAVFVSLEWSVGRMCSVSEACIDTYDLTFLSTGR